MGLDTSIVLPAKNEAKSLEILLPRLREQFPEHEIIVVDDGSTDNTVEICKHNGIKVVSHVYSMGNGAAIKTGARIAEGNILVFMDADGQHDPDDISRLVEKINSGYDMVVGARQIDSHASLARRIANTIYNRLASWMTGYLIEDLTSVSARPGPDTSGDSCTCYRTSSPTRQPVPWPFSDPGYQSDMYQ